MSSETDEITRLRAEVKHWKAHAEEAGEGFARVCKDYARVSARNVRLVEGIKSLADSIHGDSGWEHNAGCEGEPDCFACIEADLRHLASPPAAAKEDA